MLLNDEFVDPQMAGLAAAGGILGQLSMPSARPVGLGSILGQAGAAASQARNQAAFQQEQLANQRMLRQAQAEEMRERAVARKAALQKQMQDAQAQATFRQLLAESDNPSDPINVLGAGMRSGALDATKYSQLLATVHERQATREQRLLELKMRSENDRLSAEERRQAALERQREAAAAAEERIRLAAALRPEQRSQIVPTSSGILERDLKGNFRFLKHPETGETLMPNSIAGAAQFSPEALELTAKQYLSGDRQAAQGFARNATARVALQNEIARQAKEMGMTPEQVAARMADFAGIMAASRTVGQRGANIAMAASEAKDMIPIVRDTSKAFTRTSFVPANAAIKAFESGTGRPEVKAFGAALNSLVNVYARAISPGGVPTVHDKEHAREMINSIQSPEQVEAVLRVMEQELVIAQKAPEHVREALRKAVTGGGKSGGGGGAPSVVREWSDDQYHYRQLGNGDIQRRKK